MDFKYWDAKQSRKIVDCKLIVTTVDPEMLMKKINTSQGFNIKISLLIKESSCFL